jgi:FKBP-type peptidyl-prolyl cis-trans isomerase
MLRRAIAVTLVLAVVAGCRLKDSEDAPLMIPAPPDVAAPPADAIKTPSGLVSKIISPGMSNVRPEPRSSVRVHYTGWTTDGKMFDSSYSSGTPAQFTVGGVIPGWTEGLQLMVVGEKRRFWIPANLAYDGVPGAPQGMLVFDVELLGVQ